MEGSPSRVPISLRRFHLDSGTYRAVLRLLAHCVQAQPHAPLASPRLSPSRAAHGGTVAPPESESAWAPLKVPPSWTRLLERAIAGGGREGEQWARRPPGERKLEQKEEADRGVRDSDGLTHTPSPEDVELLGFSEVSPLLDASELGEDSRETRVVDESGCQKFCPASAQSRDSCSEKEQCMIEQIEIHGSSLSSMGGSGLREFSEEKNASSLSAIDENEMEEGEIPGEVGVSDSSSDLESHLAADDGMLPENRVQRIITPRTAEISHTLGAFMTQGASASTYHTKETTCSTAVNLISQPSVWQGSATEKEKEWQSIKGRYWENQEKFGSTAQYHGTPRIVKADEWCYHEVSVCEHTISSSFSSAKCMHKVSGEDKERPLTESRKRRKRGICANFSHDMMPIKKHAFEVPCHNYASEGRCNRGENLPTGELPSASAPGETGSLRASSCKDSDRADKSKQPVSPAKGVCFLSFGQLHGSIHAQRHEESPPEKSPLRAEKIRSDESLRSEAAGNDASRILRSFCSVGSLRASIHPASWNMGLGFPLIYLSPRYYHLYP
ncbi:unnamed protein product [Spirodela intermedia]|uniref:Uncharacterized protein n=1 Tax=Spirodela intermedia TaxID=51605 RepID=A0A7I8J9L4_SPIIN|nr:unnamed protein product [Spirodela intermedia]CAA6666142.1 unnamed protein product [Spirodela intermedia]